jgi:hypothetical protein
MAEGDVLAYEDLVDDRVDSAAELRQESVLGRPAAVTRYQKSQRHAAMWFADGGRLRTGRRRRRPPGVLRGAE